MGTHTHSLIVTKWWEALFLLSSWLQAQPPQSGNKEVYVQQCRQNHVKPCWSSSSLWQADQASLWKWSHARPWVRRARFKPWLEILLHATPLTSLGLSFLNWKIKCGIKWSSDLIHPHHPKTNFTFGHDWNKLSNLALASWSTVSQES